MFPEDRVLVGVINTKRDLSAAQDAHWYRIPQKKMLRGVNVEYLAFFLSGSALKKQQPSGIYYYAQRQGVELVYRRDLLPQQPNHARAGDVYYKVQISDLITKTPPVFNPNRRPVVFIHTTWDRFVHAQTIADLYSKADYYVDRIYHALRSSGLQPDRYWDAEQRQNGQGAHLRILCASGSVVASMEKEYGQVYLDENIDDDVILMQIKTAVARYGGPLTVGISLDADE